MHRDLEDTINDWPRSPIFGLGTGTQYNIGLQWTHGRREPEQVVLKESYVSYQTVLALYQDGMTRQCPYILGSRYRRKPHGRDDHPYDDDKDPTLLYSVE